MKTITIDLTDNEFAALEYTAISVQEWVEHTVQYRAKIAIDEIVTIAVGKYIAESISVPLSKEAIVQDALSRGWVKALKTAASFPFPPAAPAAVPASFVPPPTKPSPVEDSSQIKQSGQG